MDAIRYALVHIFQLGCTVHLEDIQVGANTYSFNENRPVFTKAEDVSRGSNDQGYATFFSLGGKTF
jgi:hypothetical protein